MKDEFWDEAFGGKDVLRLMADARDFRVRKNRFSVSYGFTIPTGKVLIRADYLMCLSPDYGAYSYRISFKHGSGKMSYYTRRIHMVKTGLEELTRLSLSFG